MSVASILEAMRLLKNEELVHPVYFWFSDGEEVSLLGAETLLDDMPELTDNVEYVLNFSGYGPEVDKWGIDECRNVLKQEETPLRITQLLIAIH